VQWGGALALARPLRVIQASLTASTNEQLQYLRVTLPCTQTNAQFSSLPVRRFAAVILRQEDGKELTVKILKLIIFSGCGVVA